MTKRLIRYTSLEHASKDLDAILAASNCSIILKNGKVYTGSVVSIDQSSIIFTNMRMKRQEVSLEEFDEIIIDVKSS